MLGNVLYLAAHPDDENTRFITWCAKEKLYSTHYLSLTRGDGGQNLIGPELREELGIIRTQELLAARRIDGGTQSFTRANDFGYSKTADETLRIWDREQVLADVVFTVRQLRPDVIVCRFPPDSRGGHGHHTASAILGMEAFRLAADPTAFPEQLKHVQPWQATRIVTNTGRWWNADISADEQGVVAEDVGTYISTLGTSATEIAALSRSCHRSQGFGSTGTRGEQLEYFEHLDGDTARVSLFDGMDLSWERVKGGAEIARLCARIEADFSISAPHQSLIGLLELRKAIQGLEDVFWRERKRKEVDALIRQCAGLFIEATANDHSLAAGDSLKVTLEMVNRSPFPITVKAVSSTALGIRDVKNDPLSFNQKNELKFGTVIPADAPVSHPFWLEREGTLGMYRVDDIALTTAPENRPAFSLDVLLEMGGQEIAYQIPIVYEWNDRVTGENHRPFTVTPPVVVSFGSDLQVFTAKEPREVEITVRAAAADVTGELRLMPPKGWQLDRDRIGISLKKKGEEQKVKVRVAPLEVAQNGPLQATFQVGTGSYDRAMRTITYDHIPTQVWFPMAQSRLVNIGLKRSGMRIGYLAGAGDAVADGLRVIGYTVDELTEADLTPDNLSRYGAVLTGIRFLNVNDRAAYMMPALLKYVEAGGTLIMQYNTFRGLETEGLFPYPLKLGRDRVTEEDAAVTLTLPDHPALTSPNRITAADFNDWVQERGLYFPSEWDAAYAAPLRMNDTGETPKDGSLLIAKHGKGHFVYTGISFFRQLPAGVPGAYRLIVNLVELKNAEQ